MKKNARADLILATERERKALLRRIHADHRASIDYSAGRGFDCLAATSWNLAWREIAAATCAPLCESPLEVVMLGELLGAVSPSPSYLCPEPEVVLSCQKQIGSYRVDFLIETTSYEGNRVRIVVEVDGHEFHEKTKEQARRDKERDRFFVANGFVVMRFTGSEVFNEADGCGWEVRSYIEQMHYHPDDRHNCDVHNENGQG